MRILSILAGFALLAGTGVANAHDGNHGYERHHEQQRYQAHRSHQPHYGQRVRYVEYEPRHVCHGTYYAHHCHDFGVEVRHSHGEHGYYSHRRHRGHNGRYGGVTHRSLDTRTMDEIEASVP